MNNVEKVIVFGAGKIGQRVAKMVRYDKEILFLVDNDTRKHGQIIEGYWVHPVSKIFDNKN